MGDFGTITQKYDIDIGTQVTLNAAAASGNSADLSGLGFLGAALWVNVSAITGTSPTLTVAIQGKDLVSGNYVTLFASGSISATGLYLVQLYPGDIVSSTSPVFSTGLNLPNKWRILYTIGGTTPAVTATIGVTLMQ